MNPLFLLAGGTVAALALLNKKAKAPGVPTATTGSAKPAQPSQIYPFQMPAAPRADNKNQPWYNGNPQAVQGAQTSTSTLGSIGNIASTGASVVHSLADVWGTLSGVFGGSDGTGDAKANLQSPDDWTDSMWGENITAENIAPDSYMETSDNVVGDMMDTEYV